MHHALSKLEAGKIWGWSSPLLITSAGNSRCNILVRETLFSSPNPEWHGAVPNACLWPKILGWEGTFSFDHLNSFPPSDRPPVVGPGMMMGPVQIEGTSPLPMVVVMEPIPAFTSSMVVFRGCSEPGSTCIYIMCGKGY